MSDNKLTMSLNLDLKPFKDGLRGALQLGREFSRQWQALASGLQVEVDFSSLESVFDEIAEELGDVADEADNAEKEVKELGDETEKTGKKGKKSGQDLLGVLSDLGNAYRGIRQAVMDEYQALSTPIGRFMELQSGMANTNTMLRLSNAELGGLSDQLLGIAKENGIADLTDLTKAYYDAVSAGRPELELFNQSARAARGGSASLSESIDFSTNVLNAWSLASSKAGRVFDVAFKGVERGKTTFGLLANNIGQVASTAAAAGISLEEVIAANATFTKAGNDTGKSMTYMRGTILALNKALGDGWSETMTFQEGLNQVVEMADGSATKLQELLGSQEAYAFAVALTGDKAAEAAKDLKEISSATGTADEAFKKQTGIENLRFQLDKLIASFNALMVKITEDFAPALGKLISVVTGLFNVLSNHPAIITGVVTAFTTLGIAVKAMAIRQAMLNTAMSISAALSGNWIAIAAAVAAGVGAAAFQTKLLSRSQDDYNDALEQTNKLKSQSSKDNNDQTIEQLQKTIDLLNSVGIDESILAGRASSLNEAARVEIMRIQAIIDAKKREIEERKRLAEETKRLTGEVEDYQLQVSLRLQLNNEERMKAELADAIAYQESLGPVTAKNVEEHRKAAEEIAEIQHELNEEKARIQEELAELEAKYRRESIDDEVQRQIAEIEATRDAELKKAQLLGASQETLRLIKDNYDAQARAVEEGNQQELEDTRQDFEIRSLELAGNTYDAQMDSIERFYEQRKAKLMAAGLSEQQIEEQKEAAKQRIRDTYNQRAVQGASKTLGDLAKAAKAFGKKGFAVWKRLAQIQAIVDTYSGATAAYKSMAGIPYVGPVLGAIAAAAAIAAGLANVAEINKQKFATGGFVKGKSHAQGGELIEVEGGEHVTRKSRVAALGRRIFDFLNNAPLAQVQAAIGNMMFPSIPVPATVGGRYADGGVVSSGLALNSLVDEIRGLRADMVVLNDSVQKSRSVTYVAVDSALADAVKISEKAEEGDRQRSRI